MKLFILISGIVIIVCLIAEKKSAVRHRRVLKHVVHVNGTRGKSSVTRLIAAGLSGCGMSVFCKTTGTLPMTIDPSGKEELIKRRGSANIKEQITYLKKAAESGAEVLVVECMAVDPELQRVCERDILRSDVGVITNVRIDHVAEMGRTRASVCDALCGTIPENAVVFTADSDSFKRIESAAKTRNSKAVLADSDDSLNTEDPFPENTALALAVCEYLGCDRESALKGMLCVKPDPYAASVHSIPGDCVFINGMSANDPLSTKMLYERLAPDRKWEKRIIVLNCRSDRGYRTALMIDFIADFGPDEVWLLGQGAGAASLSLKRKATELKISRFGRASDLPLEKLYESTVVYAIGNIANEGMELMRRVISIEEKGDTDICTDR